MSRYIRINKFVLIQLSSYFQKKKKKKETDIDINSIIYNGMGIVSNKMKTKNYHTKV